MEPSSDPSSVGPDLCSSMFAIVQNTDRSVLPSSHLLYGNRTAAIESDFGRFLVVTVRRLYGHRTVDHNILEAVDSP